MRIVVAMRQLADLVEELEVDESGTDIDREFVKFISNEWDEAALEQALLARDAGEAEVVVVALDEPDVDQTLYSALAKGADRAVKLCGGGSGWITTHDRSAVLARWLSGQEWDLVYTGVQAADDLDGQLAPLLGAALGVPHASVVVHVEIDTARVRIVQELGGGLAAEEQISLPAVLGIQTAAAAPRYAPISRIRQAMQSGGLEEVAVEPPRGQFAGLTVRRLFSPEQAGHAEMLNGSAGDVAGKILELLRAKGLVKS
jgi:electron transfer flavoprotein beta subunit